MNFFFNSHSWTNAQKVLFLPSCRSVNCSNITASVFSGAHNTGVCQNHVSMETGQPKGCRGIIQSYETRIMIDIAHWNKKKGSFAVPQVFSDLFQIWKQTDWSGVWHRYCTELVFGLFRCYWWNTDLSLTHPLPSFLPSYMIINYMFLFSSSNFSVKSVFSFYSAFLLILDMKIFTYIVLTGPQRTFKASC